MDKVRVEVAIDRDLAEDADAFDVSLPQALEEGLRARIGDAKSRRWREENAEAIRISNEELARNGLWSDEYRMF